MKIDSWPPLILYPLLNFTFKLIFNEILLQVYKSNSKRKEHILKSHPGAKLPGTSERVSVNSFHKRSNPTRKDSDYSYF